MGLFRTGMRTFFKFLGQACEPKCTPNSNVLVKTLGMLCYSNVVQVPLSLNPFQLNLEFGTTHRVQMCYTSKQVQVQVPSMNPNKRQQVTVIYCCMTAQMLQYSIY